VYNKNIDTLFGWSMHEGKKIDQEIRIPSWIESDPISTKFFIKGLFESDGSIYSDRGYKMANLVSYNQELVQYANEKITQFGFVPRIYTLREKNGMKHTLRISKNVDEFIALFNIQKS
jgi:intein/homing endonuclease